MSEVTPLPTAGGVFFDPRDAGRSLRVSWHPVTRTYVLSIWRDGACAASFRLRAEDAPEFVRALVAVLVLERGASEPGVKPA